MKSQLSPVPALLVRAVLLAMLLIPGASLRAAPPAQAPHGLVDFNLKDQFNQVYTPSSFQQPVLVFLCADRKGSDYTDKWQEVISSGLGSKRLEHVQFVNLADVSTVPFFMKGFVRGKFPQDRQHWSLMDWDGLFAKTYDMEADACTILVFDKSRSLVHQLSGREVEESNKKALVAALNKLLPGEEEPVAEEPPATPAVDSGSPQAALKVQGNQGGCCGKEE